ncbi:aminotransferase class I/II-fold pyridoxal phosphate-dependent enzyme [candidate division WOR-3 bacterium]|nr:aminotransferase class I/II-fold pyridoxal phosphate-dependent enzyme [candidate division WOR-3 bacterium]
MIAVILAAGMGKRLKDFTADNTKCMVLLNGKPIIDYTLENISILDQIEKIVIVAGYKAENLKNHIGGSYNGKPVLFVENPDYYKTNNIYSLFLAKEYLLSDDILLLESDVVFEVKALSELLSKPEGDLVLVAKYRSWMDGTVVKLNPDNEIQSFIGKKDFVNSDIEYYYKTVNIYKFSKEFLSNHYVPFLEAYCKSIGHNEYYEQVLSLITFLDKSRIKAVVLNEKTKWFEIDDLQDLRTAELLFAGEDKILSSFKKIYGGFWKFPEILDFCYLVNPFFPPDRMKEEFSAYAGELTTHYPSGLDEQNSLASRLFKVSDKYLTVGNGASEIINAVAENFKNRKTVIIEPTFDEYTRRFCNIEKLYLKNFNISGKDLPALVVSNEVFILINPDNPTGRYFSVSEILSLALKMRKEGKFLVLDESFVDFSDEGEKNSLLRDEVLEDFPNMIVVKSISKSYGVPGVRLGLAACSDPQITSFIKNYVSVWNVNSFAEFFLQTAVKYKEEYRLACEKVSVERRSFINNLEKLSWIKPYPSQANYIFCSLEGVTANRLAQKLLSDHMIFIKDCTGKDGITGGEFVRIAVKKPEENEVLLKALISVKEKGFS